MGSFNEVCALSSLNIPYDTPVRLLFLTQNPYVVCDQREAQRGCYPTDQWFVRTPPIKGTYDDYGNCKFKEDSTTELICEVFRKDVIERPFGFNQYHAGDVTKSKGIHHFLQAAWQGRLLVQDEYTRPRKGPPLNFPTWQNIQEILKGHNLPIQSESKRGEGCAGYNAQPVIPGVVCVTFNSYDNNMKRLKKVLAILEKDYDCRILYKYGDRKDDPCLMVAPQGAYADPRILHNPDEVSDVLNTHPERQRDRYRQLPVLAVMIREDVWQTYCAVTVKPSMFEEHHARTVDTILDKLKETCEKYRTSRKELTSLIINTEFRNVLFDIPFQTTLITHIDAALEKEQADDDLLQACAELARVEYIMGNLHHSWHIPSLGGQEGNWALRTALLTQIAEISQKMLDEEMSEA